MIKWLKSLLNDRKFHRALPGALTVYRDREIIRLQREVERCENLPNCDPIILEQKRAQLAEFKRLCKVDE